MLLDKIYINSKGTLTLVGFLLLLIPNILLAQKESIIERDTILMGSKFRISIVSKDTMVANQQIDSAINEIIRIENLISEWRSHTQVSEINRQAGIKPVKVDKELFDLTKRAISYSEMSDGAFDISIAALDKVWLFDGSMIEKPTAQQIQQSIAHVGYKNILLDSIHSTIFLEKKNMKIGFGSIGKGYAADKGRMILQSLGVKSGIVDASGDISTWGNPPKQKHWKIGIRNPFKRNGIAKILKLNNDAVATSGSYEKYAEINDIRYSHIINPKTGYPSSGLTSVTVYGFSAEFANALSTSIMVLGEKKGKHFAKQHPAYKFLFITDKGHIINQ